MWFTEKKVLLIIASVSVIISLSFYAGMEYQSYRIGKKISEAFSSFWGNSNSEEPDKKSSVSTQKKIEKQYAVVSAWNAHTMSGSKDWTISVYIGTTEVGKKEIQEDYMKYTAKNSYTTVDITVENTGKTPTSLYIGNAKLILADGTTYEAESSNQIKGCVGCSMNPWSKETESILFDANIAENQLGGAKLEIADTHFIVK